MRMRLFHAAGCWPTSGEKRTPGSEHSLDVHLSRLRKILASGDEGNVLIRRGGGYLLRVEAGSLDLARFEQHIDAGERALAEGHPAEAAKSTQGLGLWRGEPLAEIPDAPFVRAETSRRSERRLVALQARIDADLALGREARVAGELESLVDANPFRERFRAQLMLASTGPGGKARRWRFMRKRARCSLTSWGSSRGEELRELQRRILAQDPGLPGPTRVGGLRRPAQARREFSGRGDGGGRGGACCCSTRPGSSLSWPLFPASWLRGAGTRRRRGGDGSAGLGGVYRHGHGTSHR